MSINTDKNVVAFFSSDYHVVKWQPFILLNGNSFHSMNHLSCYQSTWTISCHLAVIPTRYVRRHHPIVELPGSIIDEGMGLV